MTDMAPGARLAPRPPRVRRLTLSLASVALVALSVAVFCSIYAAAGHMRAVLAAVHPVDIGQTITPGDLAEVDVASAGGMGSIAVGQAPAVVGRQAAVSLVPGSLLVPGDVVTSFAPAPGQSLVGVALHPSQMPASGIVAGDRVDVVLTGQPGSAGPVFTSGPDSLASPAGAGSGVTASSGANPGTLLATAVPVVGQSTPTSADAGTTVVTLEVPRAVAPFLAAASTAGEVALVEVAPRS